MRLDSPAMLQPDIDAVVKPLQALAAASGTRIKAWAEPIETIHFGPGDQDLPGAKPTMARSTVQAIGAVGLLILLMAVTNYVALMTARAGRRATEVAVRKAAGAGRGDLIRQFLGESLVHVLIAMLLAMALGELGLPLVNSTLDQALRFDLLHDPLLAPLLIAIVLVVALLAGLYPAFILSAFRPPVALRGGSDGASGAVRVRQMMVAIQFAILVGLAVAALTIYRQTNVALGSSLAAGREPMLLLVVDCSKGMAQAARELPGVKAATCADGGALNFYTQGAVTVITKAGRRYTPGYVSVDPWFFPTFGIQPVAGRLFSPDALADKAQRRIVINETAARNFGFASPREAVGQTIRLSLAVGPNPPTEPREIIGVVADRPANVMQPAGELIYNAAAAYTLAVNKHAGRFTSRASRSEVTVEEHAGWPTLRHQQPRAVRARPLPGHHHAGLGDYRLRRDRRGDRGHGSVRACRLHGAAAHAGDRPAQGHGCSYR